MFEEVSCNVCDERRPLAQCEQASVRSNVRKFRAERFAFWRCPRCRSLHARDAVDLAHYYAGYPSFPESIDRRLRTGYANLLERLTAAGLQKQHRILDYGCGSGAFVRFLRARGYELARGYDAYAAAFADPSALQARYDCVISQDVIEHVDDPRALLRRFDELALPGGLIAIGTPDAAAIDLSDPEDYVHALHAPYHRHILASAALREQAAALGWTLVCYYSTMYGNTLIPGENQRGGLHYLRCHDDCLDLLTEPMRFDSWRLYTPLTAFFVLFGYFFDRHTDVMFTFRSGPGR
jgi:2-polyprenyl-3-methyl-5-hydroxy-6-metoxy-1,4-benzoquinol methylase